MAMAGSWNWDNVSTTFWAEPSEDVYYLLTRWKKAGLNSILDLGCGIGRHSLLFAENGFEVTALDSSESGLRRLEIAAAERGLAVETVHAELGRMRSRDAQPGIDMRIHPPD